MSGPEPKFSKIELTNRWSQTAGRCELHISFYEAVVDVANSPPPAVAQLRLVRPFAVDRIENMMNWLTDQDWGWRTFPFLRPDKDRDMRNAFLLKMALCYGSILAVLLSAAIFG